MSTRGLVAFGIVACLGGCSSDKADHTGDTAAATTGTSTTGDTASTSDASTTGSGGTTGTGGAASTTMGGTAGTGMTDTSVPPSDSMEDIYAFLESGGYEQEGWLSALDTPREPEAGSTSPHGMVRVYLSPAVVEFKQMEPDAGVSPAVPGAMAVKEFYDDPQGSPLGFAVLYYFGGSWTYYCYGPAGRCAGGTSESTSDTALYGDVSDCRFCHGGNVYTSLPQ